MVKKLVVFIAICLFVFTVVPFAQQDNAIKEVLSIRETCLKAPIRADGWYFLESKVVQDQETVVYSLGYNPKDDLTGAALSSQGKMIAVVYNGKVNKYRAGLFVGDKMVEYIEIEPNVAATFFQEVIESQGKCGLPS